MKNTHTNERGDSVARNMVRVAFCTKLGAEEWTEELLTDQEEQIPAATKWAEANGYKVRVANINLGAAPNWAACVNASQ